MSSGTINFKTLAVSSEKVNVFLLRSNVTYFYDSSIGIARTPEFFDEWITEDVRSISDELMDQYTAWGLTTGYTNLQSALQGLVSIPAKVYMLPPLGDTKC